VNLKAEEKERIESLIRLYLLFFKRNKKGFIYNVNSNKINLISRINFILLNLTLFNKAEILNIKVCLNSVNDNVYIEGLKEMILGLKNLKALIFQFDDSDKSVFLKPFHQIIHVSKNLVYLILTFSDYTGISEIFIQIILDILSLDKLYALYISQIKIKHEDLKKILNLLKSLKKLKFFGLNTDCLDSDDLISISNCFIETKSIYIGSFSANKINISNSEEEIKLIKEKVVSNKTLSVLHIQEKFNLYIF
jgi:hypothetical protein